MLILVPRILRVMPCELVMIIFPVLTEKRTWDFSLAQYLSGVLEMQ